MGSCLWVTWGNPRFDAVANVVLSTPEPSAPFAVFAEFSLKLVMNMVTTGANTVSVVRVKVALGPSYRPRLF